MLPAYLLTEKIQDFINHNIETNIAKLALQKSPFPEVNWREIINQIATKARAKEKLPSWFNQENILYPSKISLEQTSSEETANYKAEIVFGKNLIDLTGGFGVDDYHFAKKMIQVIHCELNHELSSIVTHNFNILKQTNIQCIAGNSHDILQDLNQTFDWIYIDPSRRNDFKGKVFMLKDCLPNVPQNLDFYFSFSNNILVKTAPILDITSGLNELKNVKRIHIIAINNEVKELIWELKKSYDGKLQIKTVNFNKDVEDKYDFYPDTITELKPYSLPKKYLYEPNAAILKSGAFEQIASHYNVEKLHQHSHLYTSDKILDFPGRVFSIEKIIEYHKSEIKLHLENTKSNITTRNFPETVKDIRKKWKIKEGGNTYSFFTTDVNNRKIVLICAKI